MKIFYVYSTIQTRKVRLDFQQSISAYGLTPPKTRIFGRLGHIFGYPDFGVKTSPGTLILHARVTYNS